MANEYYDNQEPTERFVSGEFARGSDVDAKFDAIEVGFDKLPTEAELKSGNLNYATDTGAADAYAIASAYPIASYAEAEGRTYTWKALNANTGVATLNLDGQGAKTLKRTDGSNLQAGDIKAGSVLSVVYDGTNFQVVSAVQGMIDDATAQATAAAQHKDDAETAQTAAETAQGLAEDAQAAAETAETNSADNVDHSEEWANKAEDSPVSVAAGGDGSTTFSALHHAAKAYAYALLAQAFSGLPDPSGHAGEAVIANALGNGFEMGTAGAMILLEEAPITNDLTVEFTDIDDTYDVYVFQFVDVENESSATLYSRTSTDNGTTYDDTAGDYQWWMTFGANGNGSTSADAIPLTSNVLTGNGRINGEVRLFKPAGTNYTDLIFHMNHTSHYANIGNGTRLAAEDVNAIQFYMSADRLVSGTIRRYGIAK